MVLVSPSSDGGEVAADGTKKKKITTHLEKSDGRRLVEYLVVVSSLERKSLSEGGGDGKGESPPEPDEQYRLSTEIDDDDIELVDHDGFKPVVTARYPQYDHEDNPFDANVSYFCHISGAIQLKKQPFMPKVRYEFDLFIECPRAGLCTTVLWKKFSGVTPFLTKVYSRVSRTCAETFISWDSFLMYHGVSIHFYYLYCPIRFITLSQLEVQGRRCTAPV